MEIGSHISTYRYLLEEIWIYGRIRGIANWKILLE
jgi:hypothetical protein